jgi:tetratricopeptide (TPR) repeat protein
MAIAGEAEFESHQLLSSTIKKLLQTIQPIFNFEFRVFEEQQLVDLINQFIEVFYSEEHLFPADLDIVIEKFNLREEINKLSIEKKFEEDSQQLNFKRKYLALYHQNHYIEQAKTEIKPAIAYCFNHIESLSGLAKFVALIYQAKNCVQSQQLLCLKQAKEQAETILLESDTEFSSGLFLWDLGHSFFEFKHYEEAVTSYDRALEINPKNDSAWYNRSSALGSLGKFEDVVTSCDRALEINPKNDSAWYNRGRALNNLGRYEEAIKSSDHALAIKPDSDYAWNNRGLALDDLGRLDEAIESYDHALEIKPDKDSAWYNRGNALNNLGRYEEAIESFDRYKVNDQLGQAIVKTIPALMPEVISDKAAQTWLETWQELTGDRPEFQIPLRLLKTAVDYKISKGDRRILLQLAMEERDLLEPLLEARS